jgi:hypothetical protein
MYSIIFTLAFFVAIILNDVLQNHSRRVVTHAVFGLIATSLVSILWYLNYEFVSWVLISIPVIALIVGYALLPSTSSSIVTSVSSPPGMAQPSGIASVSAPIICNQYNPGGPYTAVAPSTVSLPATTPSLPPPTTAPTTPDLPTTFNITPIVPTC